MIFLKYMVETVSVKLSVSTVKKVHGVK